MNENLQDNKIELYMSDLNNRLMKKAIKNHSSIYSMMSSGFDLGFVNMILVFIFAKGLCYEASCALGIFVSFFLQYVVFGLKNLLEQNMMI